MALIACPVANKRKSIDLVNAFIKGAPKDAEGYVFYGVNDSNMAMWRAVRQRQADFYYLDNSFLDAVRGTEFRVAKNRIQVRSCDRESDGKRLAEMGIKMQPWQHNPNGHWLVIEQSPTFMRDIAADPAWLERSLAWAKSTGLEVRLRRWSPDKKTIAKTLHDDLKGARGVITHSSAAGVEAVIAGIVPVVSNMSGLAGCEFDTSDDVDGGRLRFLGVLADNQWTLKDLQKGEAWAWLNQK